MLSLPCPLGIVPSILVLAFPSIFYWPSPLEAVDKNSSKIKRNEQDQQSINLESWFLSGLAVLSQHAWERCFWMEFNRGHAP